MAVRRRRALADDRSERLFRRRSGCLARRLEHGRLFSRRPGRFARRPSFFFSIVLAGARAFLCAHGARDSFGRVCARDAVRVARGFALSSCARSPSGDAWCWCPCSVCPCPRCAFCGARWCCSTRATFCVRREPRWWDAVARNIGTVLFARSNLTLPLSLRQFLTGMWAEGSDWRPQPPKQRQSELVNVASRLFFCVGSERGDVLLIDYPLLFPCCLLLCKGV